MELINAFWKVRVSVFMVEKTPAPGEDYQPRVCDHYSATCLYPGRNLGCSGDQHML